MKKKIFNPCVGSNGLTLTLLAVCQTLSCQGFALNKRSTSPYTRQSKHGLIKHIISSESSENEFSSFLRNIKDISTPNGQVNLLDAAVQERNLMKISLILDQINKDKQKQERRNGMYKDPSFPNSINPLTGLTPLGLAIKQGDIAIVKLLIEHKYINVTKVGKVAKTSLLWALANKNEAMALTLLAHTDHRKALPSHCVLDITRGDEAGNTPLHWSIRHNFKNLAEALVKKLALQDLCIEDNTQSTPLQVAVHYGRKKIFSLLFDRIAQLCDSKKTLMDHHLKLANPISSSTSSVATSLFAVAYLPKNKYLQATHIWHACEMFRTILETVKAFLSKQDVLALLREMDYFQENGTISRWYANKLHHVIKATVPPEFIPCNSERYGLTDDITSAYSVDTAPMQMNRNVKRIISRSKPLGDMRLSDQNMAVMDNISERKEMIQALKSDNRPFVYHSLDNIHLTDNIHLINDLGDGLTALLVALHTKNEKMAQLLVNYNPLGGSKVDIVKADREGNTPLHLCIQHGFRNMAHALIQRLSSEEVCLPNAKQNTPLHLAIQYGNREIASALAWKVSIQGAALQNKKGETPLHLSVQCGLDDITKTLVDKLTLEDLCTIDHTFKTPLLIAAEKHRKVAFKRIYDKIVELSGSNQDVIFDAIKPQYERGISVMAAAYLCPNERVTKLVPGDEEMLRYILNLVKQNLHPERIAVFSQEIDYITDSRRHFILWSKRADTYRRILASYAK